MKILMTGTDGYIGSIVAPFLLEKGHEITGVDSCFYRSGHLYNGIGDHPHTKVKDIRNLKTSDFIGNEVLIHMAELSNDPTGELSPEITHEINYRGTIKLAQLAKNAGIKTFIYMSSCSVYGLSNSNNALTETCDTNPQTAYAKCKVLSENGILDLADSSFSPVVLRNATVFGTSPRQRLDVVVNNLCALAWTQRRIELVSDGTPWRPVVHTQDIAQLIDCILHASTEVIHAQIFNVGSNQLNYQIRDLATIVADEFPGCVTSFGIQSSDNRSYRVNFDKLHMSLPDFSCKWNVQSGAKQFHSLFKKIEFNESDHPIKAYTRLNQLQYLLRTKQIDRNLYWNHS